MKADLVIYDPFHGRSIPVHDPVSAIVYSSSQANIESVMVDGVFVMEHKRMTMIDEEKYYMPPRRRLKADKRSGAGQHAVGQEDWKPGAIGGNE